MPYGQKQLINFLFVKYQNRFLSLLKTNPAKKNVFFWWFFFENQIANKTNFQENQSYRSKFSLNFDRYDFFEKIQTDFKN